MKFSAQISFSSSKPTIPFWKFQVFQHLVMQFKQIHCGDKIPKTYVSEGHEIEIAFAVVNMYRDDRGLIYKFTYEATRARKSKRNASEFYFYNCQIFPYPKSIQTANQILISIKIKIQEAESLSKTSKPLLASITENLFEK